MRRIYHTVHFEGHDEKALHEFVRKRADPEEFSAMEKLDASQAQLLNHDFQDYLTRFGELQKLGRIILERLATGQRKAS